MFSEASVSHSVHGGVCPMTPPSIQNPQVQTPFPPGCRLLDADPPMQTPQMQIPTGILRDMVNKRAMRILLECILVSMEFSH